MKVENQQSKIEGQKVKEDSDDDDDDDDDDGNTKTFEFAIERKNRDVKLGKEKHKK